MRNTANWILRTHLFRPDEYICSRCRTAQEKPSAECPACGRKMSNYCKYDPSWVDEAEGLSSILDDDW